MSASDDQYSVHLDPIWRQRANFIINAPLPEEGRYEQLWCRQVTEETFELCCIPFFLYDMALGDVVQTETQSGRKYMVSEVVERSGRYVFRAVFEPAMLGKREEVAARLTDLGALLEWSSASMIAVDARDAEHGQEIADFLFDHETKGRLIYETGRLT
ncbi:DUF4265 domain-containing protein [Agromyces cerinus]|uniref:DUF4265 domain-containing protein n=1 Tax=Agromyces cerinus subsp. cerinus TaxID=232089 RepID=A0A1N6DNF7_9MICO|nr:DUF4265 domain-containing protein [Agromyces cerinus]SIN72214.1 protein of unknown function [Agromyces cerinus subsp. cerinus]